MEEILEKYGTSRDLNGVKWKRKQEPHPMTSNGDGQILAPKLHSLGKQNKQKNRTATKHYA